MTFAEHLRNIRGDLSQKAFCRKLGIPLTTYQRYDVGLRVPDVAQLAQIVRRVGISADTLLELDHVPAPQGTEKNTRRDSCKTSADQKDLIIARQAETIKNLRQAIKRAKLAARK